MIDVEKNANAEIEIRSVLHLYLKVWGTISESKDDKYINGEWALSCGILEAYLMGKLKFVPHLRRLTDMERPEIISLHYIKEAYSEPAHQFKFLLSRGFDIFGLIDKGLAIESAAKPSHTPSPE